MGGYGPLGVHEGTAGGLWTFLHMLLKSYIICPYVRIGIPGKEGYFDISVHSLQDYLFSVSFYELLLNNF